MKTHKPLLVLLTIFSPFLASCVFNSNADTQKPAVIFTVIVSGDRTISGSPENRKIEVFTNQASFNSNLSIYGQPYDEHTVDFSTRKVLLLSLGGQSSGGSSISTEKLEDYGEYIKATILIIKPGDKCIGTSSEASPYQFIEIESTKELVFEEKLEVKACA